MAVACLGGGSSPASGEIEQVVREADGLPLLVEDLLATGERGGLPRRFTDTVRARLARLDAGERRVLSAAAILGHRFDWRLLPAIAGLNGNAVAVALHRCAALQLVVADGGTFMFRHALTREIVEAETGAIEHQQLCLAVARALIA